MRRRLILVFLATSGLVTVAFIVPLAALVQRTVADRAIDGARVDAAAVVPSLISDGSRDEIEASMLLTAAGQEGRMSILTSQDWRIGPEIVPSERVEEALTFGVSDIGPVDDGMEVVSAVASGPQELSVIRVFVPRSMLWDGVIRAWAILAAIGTFLIAISVVVADLLARSVVKPTQDLAMAARRLGRGELDTRVEPSGPDELVDLAGAINNLGGQVSTMLTRERELVADLSHRLRTPLTKLRLRIDHVKDPELAADLKSDVDDITAVVTNVIREARGAMKRNRRCDAAEIVTERAQFWAALAEDQQRPLRLVAGASPLPVAVDPTELGAVIDNLVDNVFVHTDEGCELVIGFDRSNGSARIWVADGGPGFPADFDATQRGRSGGTSTGLGLDIARQLADEAGGRLDIGSGDAGGSQVTLSLPLAPLLAER